MNRVQQIHKAKSYIDMLSHDIDPTTGEAIEDSILKNKQIKDTFAFISSVLDELISNGGEVIYWEKPVAFQPALINKELVSISDNPISVISLVARINKQVNKQTM